MWCPEVQSAWLYQCQSGHTLPAVVDSLAGEREREYSMSHVKILSLLPALMVRMRLGIGTRLCLSSAESEVYLCG